MIVTSTNPEVRISLEDLSLTETRVINELLAIYVERLIIDGCDESYMLNIRDLYARLDTAIDVIMENMILRNEHQDFIEQCEAGKIDDKSVSRSEVKSDNNV